MNTILTTQKRAIHPFPFPSLCRLINDSYTKEGSAYDPRFLYYVGITRPRTCGTRVHRKVVLVGSGYVALGRLYITNLNLQLSVYRRIY